MSELNNLVDELTKAANPERAKLLTRFFKTGPGQYGEGDFFLGLNAPEQRKIAAKYASLTFDQLQKLLDAKYHEFRLVALLILTIQYKKANKQQKEEIAKFYLKNTHNINNWDLVDVTTPHILGNYYLDKDKEVLYKLARSNNLWERRIAILTTFGFIRQNQFEDALKISEILLQDKHDLIHKAVGWMLREIGKRNQDIEEEFLKKHASVMPRTMLRYAIEKFTENKRQYYLKLTSVSP